MISQETVDRIFDLSQITEVVGDFITLKRRGVNYIGLCPFHNEKTPSFIVSPSKNIFKCFGCGKGGNPVNFVMEHEKLTFYEALRYLAKKYQIEIEEKDVSPEDREKRDSLESLMVVNEFAKNHFVENLHQHPEGIAVGLSYLKERGIRDDMIEKFQLGYAPDKRDFFSQIAIKNGYKKEYLISTGLSIDHERGLFDRFAGRVIFPIHSKSGKTIGFGGRILKTDKNTAKYLNSPESEIYHKSKTLYGIFFASRAIQKFDKCYLVEGYTDVISLHQCNIENVVASSGTSLTEDQVRMIKNLTSNLTIIYDGDPAGVKAALRGIGLVLTQEINVKILLLPDGHDPDSFSKTLDSSELIDYINKNEVDFIRFKTHLLLEEAKDDPMMRANLITDMVHTIALIPNGIVRSVYIKECSVLLSVDESLLYTEVNKILKIQFEKNNNKTYRPDNLQVDHVKKPDLKNSKGFEAESQERELCRLMVLFGHIELLSENTQDENNQTKSTNIAEYIIQSVEMDDMQFEHPVYRAIYDEINTQLNSNNPINEKKFLQHSNPEISKYVAGFYDIQYEPSKIWAKNNQSLPLEQNRLIEIVPQTLLAYKNKKVLALLKNMQLQLIEANHNNDLELIEVIQKDIVRLNHIKQNFSKELGCRVILR